MRALTAQQTQWLSSLAHGVFTRVRINSVGLVFASGTFTDLTALNEYDWVKSVSITENIDNPVAAAQISLWRNRHQLSLATFMQGSALNLPAGTYSPMIDISRGIVVEVAITPSGNKPNDDTVWIEVFRGFVDEVEAGGSAPALQLNCRDQASILVDTWIESEISYGSSAGDPVEGVIQSILDDYVNSLALYDTVTLYSPNGTVGTPFNAGDSPAFGITPYVQSRKPVWEALLDLVKLFGWDIRYRWHANTSAYQLQLYDPQRSKVTPDGTLYTSDYFDVTKVNSSRADIRNAIRVSYISHDATGRPADFVASNPSSINRYGRRFMQIAEGTTSLIQTAAQATALATAVLDDLMEPTIIQQVDARYNPAVELCDLLTLTANGVHYDTDQTQAVTEIKQVLDGDKPRTQLGTRGKPASGYMRWIGSSSDVIDVPVGINTITPGNLYKDTQDNANLIPNGQLQALSGGQTTTPPAGWVTAPKWPIPAGVGVDPLGTWGTDWLMSNTYQYNGNAALKCHSNGTTRTLHLYIGDPIPVAPNDVLGADLFGLWSANPTHSSQKLKFIGLDKNKANPGLLNVNSFPTIEAPGGAGVWYHQREYFDVQDIGTYRYVLPVLECYFYGADGTFDVYFGKVGVFKVHQVSRLYGSTDSFVYNVAKEITFANAALDIPLGSMNADGKTFTAIQSGAFHVDAGYAITSQGYWHIALVKNGVTTLAGRYFLGAAAGEIDLRIMWSGELVAGDYLRLVGTNFYGGTIAVINSDQTTFFSADHRDGNL